MTDTQNRTTRTADPTRAATTAAQRWTLALAAAASFMVALDQLVVASALSTLQRELHASLEILEWTVNAYNVTFAVLLMTGAALGDRWGRRRLFGWGLALFTAASAACALSPGVGWLIAARVVQGAGAALVMPLAMALLSAAFPPRSRGRALGLFAALTGLAVAAGPLVGGAVTQGLDWRWIFWLNVPVGLVLVPAARARLVESVGPPAGIDVVGLLLAAGGTLGLVWGLVRGNAAAGWSSAEVIGAMAAGLALAAGFVVRQGRAAHPMLPLRLFRSAAFAAGNASAFLLYGALYSAVFFIAQYLQVGLGYSPLEAGLRTLPWTTTIFVAAPVAGALVERVGPRVLISSGLLLQAVGLAWIALDAHAGRGYAASVPALVIAGIGVSMAMPSGQRAVLNSVPPQAIGKASGTYNMLRQLGGVFGIAILAATFAAHGSYDGPAAFTAGVAPAIGVGAGLSLLGALIALATPGRDRAAVTGATASPAPTAGTPAVPGA